MPKWNVRTVAKLRITRDGVTLVEGESYTVTVTNNKTVGSTATITIQGIGAYTCIAADGMNVAGFDAEASLRRAMQEAAQLAVSL